MVIKITRSKPTVQVTEQVEAPKAKITIDLGNAPPPKKISIGPKSGTKSVAEGSARPITPPAPEPAFTPPPKFNPNLWKDWPVASSIEELEANRNSMRPPEPRACTLCGQSYPFPCDGKSASCVNATFVKGKVA